MILILRSRHILRTNPKSLYKDIEIILFVTMTMERLARTGQFPDTRIRPGVSGRCGT